MIERIAADIVVLLHFAFIVFVGLGGLLCLRWKWMAWLHLPAAAWGVMIEFRQGICPLTPLEQRLRTAAGEDGYSGSFVEHYLLPVIYPIGLEESFQFTLGILGILSNLAVYAWVLRRGARRSSGKSQDLRL